jgi:uncharacterized protein
VRASEDIIIVGGGIAGIVAAIELLQRGFGVLIVDRDLPENFGGQARESFGGIFVVDTPLQRRQGIRDTPELALEDWQRFGELAPQDGWPWRWAQAYVGECRAQVYDWLVGLGVRFLPQPQWPERRGNSVPRWHIVWGTGQRLADRLIAALHEAAALPGRKFAVRFSQRVERLLIEDERVAGVSGIREDDGAPFEIRGAAVLVAAGGMTGDSDLVRRQWPEQMGAAPQSLLIGAHRYADGRMHRASAQAGAQLRHLERMWNYAAGVRHWRPRQPDHGLSLVPPRSALWLDAQGRRFDPPLLAGWDTSELVARIGAQGGESWQVMNRHIALRELAVSGAECNPALRDGRFFAFARDLIFGNRWLVDTLAAQCPDVVTGESVARLVERMNALAGPGRALRPEEVERALREFDATRVDGDDPQRRLIAQARRWSGDRIRTARPGAILDPAHGPLIAIRERIITRKSLGGIVTDLDGRALDAADRAVGGLYAAGESAGFGGGGMNGKRALEGTFLGGCIHSARRAACGISMDLKGAST